MIKVGVTGGIATGKSFVCSLFEHLGIAIYNSDVEAKNLVEQDFELKKEITSLLGAKAYHKNGKYNTRYISSIVFQDPTAKEALNKLVHPRVMSHSHNWFLAREKFGDPYAIKESALLIESKNYLELDKLIIVDAPVDVRVARLMYRDQISKEVALKKINSQMRQDEKLNYADFTVYNDGLVPVIPQVLKLHHELMKLSKLPL